MYFDVQLEICSLMVFSFYMYSCSCTIVAWWWPSWCGNWSAFNKHIHKNVSVVTGDCLDRFINIWKPYTAFVLRPSVRLR